MGVLTKLGHTAFNYLTLSDADLITPGTQVNGTFERSNQRNLYQFDAVAGESYFFDFLSQSNAANADWALVDPFNNVVFSNRLSNDVGSTRLNHTGTYVLSVAGSRFESGSC